MMSKIKEIYKKYKEIILYIFFGVLTTAVDLLVFVICDFLFGESLYLLSTLFAWLVATVFAYFVNKLYVFNSKSWSTSTVVRETVEFFVARVFSLGINELGMFLLIDVLSFKDIAISPLGIPINGNLIAKAIVSVIVIVLNYFFSKLIIFKKAKTTENPSENNEENQ